MEDERVLTRQGLQRKAELLEHAERLFAERGYAETRMVDIAEAAGVTKGNVYWYFETKEALAREIALDARERLRAAQFEAVKGVHDPLDIIYVATVASVRYNVDESPLYGPVAGISDPGFTAAIRESSNTHAADTIRIIERGQADGSIRTDDEPMAMALAAEALVTHISISVLRQQLPSSTVAGHVAARYNVRAMASSSEIADDVITRRTVFA